MVKKVTQAEIVIELLKQHQPCTMGSLREKDERLTPSGLHNAGTNLSKFGVIKVHSFKKGVRLVQLTGKPHRQPCQNCGTPTRLWSMVGKHCKTCARQTDKGYFSGCNQQVAAEFSQSFSICRLMHLPFGLPANTYVNYLQLKGAAQ